MYCKRFTSTNYMYYVAFFKAINVLTVHQVIELYTPVYV